MLASSVMWSAPMNSGVHQLSAVCEDIHGATRKVSTSVPTSGGVITSHSLKADISGDGLVDHRDLIILQSEWHQGSP